MVDILLAISLIVFFIVAYYIMNNEISLIWGIKKKMGVKKKGSIHDLRAYSGK